MKKVCVITGSRAEYGLLRWVMEGISLSKILDLQVVVTGMHLSPEFGLTYREIESDGFVIDRKIEMLMSSDTAVGITKSVGLGMIGIADALDDLSPDIVLLLGDRFETLSAATAAMIARVPIAHLHGGEATEGLIDEAIRHAITKMSHLHFVATKEYRNRVIQLGEDPDRVFLVGGLGIDNIKNIDLLSREELESVLEFKLGKKNLLITFHPVSLEKDSAERQMEELIKALDFLDNTHFVFTMPNADPSGRILLDKVNSFVSRNENAVVFSSLGQLRYLSLMAQVDAVVGNSSSGLIEAPTFKKWTVNIGDRQRGRIRAASVIDCEPNCEDISAAIAKVYCPSSRNSLINLVNPYGSGGASKEVVRLIEDISLENILKKRFYDLM